MLRWVSRSVRRLDWMRLRYPYKVDLQKRRRMIGRPTGQLRHNTRKAQRFLVEFVNEDIDDADRIVFRHIVFQAVGQQRRLPPILALNEPRHPAPDRNHCIKSRCFHTGWTVSAPLRPVP